MNIDLFIEKFAEQLEEITKDQLSSDTKFRELDEWTSLTALSIIAMVDEEFNVVISGDDMSKQITIGDLYNLVSSRL